MSALPAEVTELSATPLAAPPATLVVPPARTVVTTPTPAALTPLPVAMPQPAAVAAPPRAETRAAHVLERRVRRRWSIVGLAILAGSFGLTIGVLDVLH